MIYNHDCSQREYFLALIREITTDYSPDVLELDFMRFPLDFPPSVAREWTGREPLFAALRAAELIQGPLLARRRPTA